MPYSRSSRAERAALLLCSALLGSAGVATIAAEQDPRERASKTSDLASFRRAAALDDAARWQRVELRASIASGTRRRLHYEAGAIAAALLAHRGGTGPHATALLAPAGALFVAEDLDAAGAVQRTEFIAIGAGATPRYGVFDASGSPLAFEASACASCHESARRFEPWSSFPDEAAAQRVEVEAGARDAHAIQRFGASSQRLSGAIAPYGALLLGALGERARRGGLSPAERLHHDALRARFPEVLRFDPALAPDAQPAPDARVEALRSALDRHLAAPLEEDALIWAGRRFAYLGRFDEAIALFTQGLLDHPRSAKLLRHRGHRYLSTQRFDLAVADLERARELALAAPDEVEPDGAPNALGIPLTTLRSNALYHAALAHYLRGDVLRARNLWSEDLAMANNDDRRASASCWLWAAALRCGDPAAAARALTWVRDETKVIENHAYLDVLRVRRGELSADELLARHPGSTGLASAGYGLAETWLATGRTREARALLQRICVEAPPAAFGTLAAAAALARLPNAEAR